MARPFTLAERATLGAAHVNVHHRVAVMNADGSWVNLWDLFGLDFQDGVKAQEDIDTPVQSGEVTLRREAYSVLLDEDVSLAPLVEVSRANRRNDTVTYAPLLNPHRRIRVWAAVTAHEVAPAPADWKLVVDGYIDKVDPTAGEQEISVTFRDMGSELQRRFIELPQTYGTLAGTPVETVLQAIIDDNFAPGERPTLVTPVSPDWMVRTTQEPLDGSVMDAMQGIVEQFGGVLRYRFDTDGVAKLMLTMPNRAATVPDYSFGPDEYRKPKGLELSGANIRNRVRVRYQYDMGVLANPRYESRSEVREVAASIAEFRVQYMEIAEALASNINTVEEAGRMAQAAADDLAYPKAELEIETIYFWPVQLADFVEFLPNGRHFSVPQRYGVTALKWEISKGDGSTSIQTRGQPAGAYFNWLRRGTGGTPTNPLPPGTPRAFIDVISATGGAGVPWSFRFRGVRGEGVVGALQYRYMVQAPGDWGAGTYVWSAWADLPDVGVVHSFARHPTQTIGLQLEVRDVHGATGNASFYLPPGSPALNAVSGRVERAVAFEDMKFAAVAIDNTGNQLPTTIRVADTVAGRIPTRGEQRYIGKKNGDVITFSPAFQGIPTVEVLPVNVIKGEPRAKYNSTGDGTGTSAYQPTLPVVDELLAVNVSSTGCEVRARTRQPGSGGTTPVSHAFAGHALTALGHASPARNVDSAPAVDDSYAVDISGSSALTFAGTPGTVVLDVTVALQVNYDGTWRTRDRVTLSNQFTIQDPVQPLEAGDGEVVWSDVLSALQASPRMDNTDDVRILIENVVITGPGSGSFTISAGSVGYNISAGDLYASMTPPSDPYTSVVVIAREGAT